MPAYSDMSYDKLLLDGLRIVSFRPGNGPLTNEGLIKAVTMNENLKTLGYTLNPQDIIRMAQSPSADSFYEKVKEQMSDVKAKPMYPDFPTQVMEMDEAQYRMHQMVHYFSTYGLTALTGIEVSKGWLPAEEGIVSDTEKTKEDTLLLSAKTIGLVPEEEKYQKPFEHILAKRERMTDEEKEIIQRCVESGKLDLNKKIDVAFKENVKDAFMMIANAGASGRIPRENASKALYNICQHPGDVTKNLHHYLAKNRYKLRTSEKKMFVSLYDKFSDAAFRDNLIVPRSREKFTKEVFRHIDFAKFTRSSEKSKAFKEIGKERTWEAKARDMITSHDPDAIRFAAQRPGMLIRMTSMALRNGYSEKEIAQELSRKSCDISAQTLVSQICGARRKPSDSHSVGAVKTENALSSEIAKANAARTILKIKKNPLADVIEGRKDRLEARLDKVSAKEEKRIESRNRTLDAQDRIFTEVLKDRFSRIETGLEGKTVCFDKQYCLDRIDIDPSKKSMDQGYLPARTAMKIPDNAKRIRCFVYWDDSKRSVDLDLHAVGINVKNGEYLHIGWNSHYDKEGITMSGDITHNDAAEYIDIDLDKAKDMVVDMRLHAFTDVNFSEVDTCYVGIMAVDRIGQDVRLYDPKNCFVSRDITNDCRTISIGQLDVEERTLYYTGEKIQSYEERVDLSAVGNPKFSMKEYLELLVEAQGGRITEDPEAADVILTLTKPASEKEISLIDNNYFFEAKQKESDTKEKERLQEQEEEKRLEEEKEKEKKDPRVVIETAFTKVLIAEGAREAAEKIFSENDGKTAVVKDPETEKVFVADRNDPKGRLVNEKDLVKVVMGIEENAALKDYVRVMELYELRGQLRNSIEETRGSLDIGPDINQ